MKAGDGEIVILYILYLQISVDLWQLPGQVPETFLARFQKGFAITCFLGLR